MDQWEHKVIHAMTGGWKDVQQELIRLGAEGWEAVGTAGADKTIGLNALFFVVKRRVAPPPPPPDPTAGWRPDPCGRYELRYWSGAVWTAHVANSSPKLVAIDPPQTLPVVPTASAS